MPFTILRNDLTKMKVDALVNTANHLPLVGAGVDHRIHAQAGPNLLKRRQEIGVIEVGEAVISEAFDLEAQYIIHAVAPKWIDGHHHEQELLRSCYKKALQYTEKYEIESIAFPLIASGFDGFPKTLALEIAIQEIEYYLKNHELDIYLVVYDKESFEISEELFDEVDAYIDENYIDKRYDKDFRFTNNRSAAKYCCMESIEEALPNWDEVLEELDASFSETLLKLIDESGKKDSEIYKKANIDRKLFSKIRSNPNYKPSKNTAIAFAIALELDLDQTLDFIGRAGYTLSRSSMFDMIISAFIENKHYNIYEINAVLFDRDQPLLSSL